MIALLLLFAVIAGQVLSAGGRPLSIDTAVREAVLSWRSPALSAVLIPITYLGNSATIIFFCIVPLFFKRTRMRLGVPLTIGAGCSASIQTMIKVTVVRPRPEAASFLIEQGGWSFPSGHACTGLMFYGLLAFLLLSGACGRPLRGAAAAGLCLAAAIGFSRIYVGVHYPTDVLAGWCLGGALLLLFTLVYESVNSRRSTRRLEAGGGREST